MSWEFYKTDSRENIEQAYGWYQQMPEFLKTFGKPYKDKLDFVEGLLEQGNFNFVGLVENEIKAVVHAEAKNSDVVEGHLFCAKDCSLEFLSSAVSFARQECLLEYKTVVCHVLKKHKMLHSIMLRSGFLDSGLRGWQHIYRGKLMEVVYYYTVK